MKRALPLLLILLALLTHTSQAQRFEWLRIYSSSGFGGGNQFLEVHDNNVFVAGEFQGSISFGSTVLNSGSRSIYVANYDTLGNFRWAAQNGGTSSFNNVLDIDLDSTGNLYLIGYYNNSVSWGGLNLSVSGTSPTVFREGYVLKLDTQGVAQWIRGFYSPNGTIGFRGLADLSVSANKIFIAGQQTSDLQFSGSSIRLNQPNLTGSQNNIFVGELDLAGVPLNLNRIVTANVAFSNNNTIGDFEALNDSVFYFAAAYRGEYDFGVNSVLFPNTGTSFLVGVAKFTNYRCDWIARQNSTTTSFVSNPTQISVDQSGNLYLASVTNGVFGIQSSSTTQPPNFSFFQRYVFALKLNSNGVIQKLVGLNATSNSVTDVDLNANNEFLISSRYRDSVFIGGRKTFSNGNEDQLIINLDSNLNPNWYQTGGGGSSDQAISIAADEGKTAFYVSGLFRGLSQFGTTFFSGNNAFSTSILYKMNECGSNPPPLTFTGDTNLCVGEDVRIVANPPAAATFQWLRDSVQLAGEVFRDLLVNTPGNYQVIVNGSGCLDTSRNVRVNVDTLPIVTYSRRDTVCEQDAPFVLSGGLPAGGIYKGPGVVGNTFDPSLTGIGTVQIRYVFSNGGCADSATSTIFVKPAPTVFFAPLSNICISSSPITLGNAFPGGGSFSGNGVTGNQFDPALAGGGFTDITYTFTDPNGCVGTATQTIEVDTLPSVAFNAIPDQCVNAAPYNLIQGIPAGGNYSGPGVVNNQFDPSLTGTGTFTISYTLANQCGSSTATQSITVIPAPTVSLGAFSDLCEGDAAISLSGGSPSGGTYSGVGVSASSFDPAVAGIGTFTIFYDFTAANGCTSRDSSSITVNPLPITSITPNSDICLGSSINLTATGGSNYLWSTSATSATVSVSPTTSTNYSVTITSADGCSRVESTLVTVNPLPVANVSGNTTICDGDNTTLTASGGQSYLWSTSATTADITVSPTATTTYSVTVTDANGCTDAENVVVTVNPLPTVSLGSFADLCEGDAAISLSGGSPTGGTYSGTGVSAGSFDPSVAGVGTFTLFYDYTDALGCSSRDSSSITVNPLPLTSITPNSSICLGNSATLTASGGSTYLWSTSATSPSITVSPIVTTTYTVTITSADGCSRTENSTVTVNPLPTAGISGNTTICNGDNTSLTASGGQSYLWSTNDNTASITVSPTANTTYTVTVTDANGCTNTASESVTVNPLPNVTLGSFADLCQGGASVSLSGGSPTGGTYSGIGVSAGSFDPSVAGVGTFTIFYTFTDGLGCSATDSATITVNPTPTTTITPNPTICAGDTTTLIATGGTSYLWNNSAITSSINVNPPTTTNYSVTITAASGCSRVRTATVFVNPTPTASITGNNVICNGDSTTLTASGGQSYSWSNAASTATITVAPSSTTTYTVTVTDANGCTDTVNETVTVNQLPAVSLGSFADLCEDDAAITLSGGSPSGGSYSGSGVSNGNFDPSVPGVGTITIFYEFTSASGCRNVDSSTITVNPVPNSTITPDTSICEGQAIILRASGGSSYSWSNSASTASINVAPLVATNYTVTISNASACSATENVTVTVDSLPQAIVSADTAICLGDSLQLQVSSNIGTFLWSTNATSPQITVSPSNSTEYAVTTTSNQNCVVSDTISVIVNTGSPISIGPDTTLDPVNTTSFTYDAGTGFSSYLWQDSSINQTFTVNYDPAKAGQTDSVSVIVGNSSGCPSVDTALVFFDFPSGINRNLTDENGIVVSPNPTRDMVFIKFSNSIEAQRRIQIYDLKGKLVLDERYGGTQNLIRLDFLNTKMTKGVYLLNIEEDGRFYREKLVIQ